MRVFAWLSAVLLLVTSVLVTTTSAAELEWIQITADGKGFESAKSQQKFVPWGFNYDHDLDGTLIEDYWNDHWPTVENAFREMRRLGATVVRIHLQYGRFMTSASEPNEQSLAQLRRLLKLAEETGLYLDLTGLGCYHKPATPEWYDALNETERWAAQAKFWEAIAQTCANSPAVFCYDLMNEPVVPGGNKPRDDWLGPGFGGKHFVQAIALDRAGRDRPAIAKAWINTLVAAIRRHDQRHLITVGLVPWSLDRPGLSSGFVPEQIAEELDFIAVHLYPEQGKVPEAIETLKAFAAVGKPVIIEEIFPLKCDIPDLRTFIEKSRPHAVGWIGFYWGKTPEQLREIETLPAAMTLGWLELFQELTPTIQGSDVPAGEVPR